MGSEILIGVSALILGLCGGLTWHYRAKAFTATADLDRAIAEMGSISQALSHAQEQLSAVELLSKQEQIKTMRETLEIALAHQKTAAETLSPRPKKTNVVFPPYYNPTENDEEPAWSVPLDQVLSVDPQTGEPLEVQPF